VGQTGGTLIGAQPLFLPDGTTQIPAGRIGAGRYYSVLYDSNLDVDGAFVLVGEPRDFGPRTFDDNTSTALAASTTYRAPVDGYLSVNATTAVSSIEIISDSAASPTVTVAKHQEDGGDTSINITIGARIRALDYVEYLVAATSSTANWVSDGVGDLIP